MIRNNAQLLIPHVNKGKLMSASPLKLLAIYKFFVSFNISFFLWFFRKFERSLRERDNYSSLNGDVTKLASLKLLSSHCTHELLLLCE